MSCIKKRYTKYYLFFDIDGTIAKNDLPPSGAVADALRRARANGHMLFICTARTRCDIYPAITDIGFDGVISGSGSHIEIDGNVVFHAALADAAVSAIIKSLLANHVTGILEGRDRLYIVPGACPVPWELEKITSPFPLPPDMQIQKFTMHLTAEQDYQAVSEQFLEEFDLFSNDSKTFLEFISKKNTKGTALRYVLEYYGADAERSVAFGDSMNDLEMIRTSGIGVALGNGHPAVLRSADLVTGSIDQDGVATALTTLGMI